MKKSAREGKGQVAERGRKAQEERKSKKWQRGAVCMIEGHKEKAV